MGRGSIGSMVQSHGKITCWGRGEGGGALSGPRCNRMVNYLLWGRGGALSGPWCNRMVDYLLGERRRGRGSIGLRGTTDILSVDQSFHMK